MNKLLVRFLGILLIGAGVSIATAGIVQIADANGIVVQKSRAGEALGDQWVVLGNKPVVEVFVNLPLHNAPANTYNKASVPFSYKVTWAVCNNRPFTARVITRYDKNGGLHSSINGGANTQWKQVSNDTYTETSCGAKYCFTNRNSSSTSINMSDVDGNQTTLQVISKWDAFKVPDSSIPVAGDKDSSVLNIHLHWKATPSPVPSPSPSPTKPPVASPSPSPVASNRAPVAIAKINMNGGAYSSNITVTQGTRVTVGLTGGEKGGRGSFDPDGWDTVGKGVSVGGKCEWNNNLWLGTPKFEKTISNPKSPSNCDINLGPKTFTVAPGKYTYNVLRITDAGQLASNIASVTITVVAPPKPGVSPKPSPLLTPTPTNPPVTEVTCLKDGKEIVIKTTNANINCNNINNVVNVTVDNSSNNSSNNSSDNSSENNNSVAVNQKQTVTKNTVIKPTPKTKVPVAVPVTAKTGVEAVAAVAAVTLLGGSGLVYLVRKSMAGNKKK